MRGPGSTRSGLRLRDRECRKSPRFQTRTRGSVESAHVPCTSESSAYLLAEAKLSLQYVTNMNNMHIYSAQPTSNTRFTLDD